MKSKNNSIPWVKNFPGTWSLNKIRYSTSLRTETNMYFPSDIYIGLENVESSTGRLLFTETEYSEERYNVFDKGDVLFSKLRPYLAKAFIAEFAGFCTGEFIVFKMFSGDKRFLYYFLQSDWFIEIVNSSTYGTKMPRASWDFIRNLIIPLPGITEQKIICDFLDNRCAQIDSISKDIENQIELLQKYKKSLIFEKVTKGIDKSVPMKESGINWIGKIPLHWESKRIKYNCRNIGSGSTPDSGNEEYYDGMHSWIQSGDLYKCDVVKSTEKQLSQIAVDSFSTLKKYYSKFVVLAMYGASVGNVAISEIDAYVNQACCVLIPNEKNDVKYLYYWMVNCKEDLIQQSFGGGQPNISQQKIKNQPMICPPLQEQRDIATFLDIECKKIDSILADKKEQFSKINEYKKSLIYEYVTGKKRVEGVTE